MTKKIWNGRMILSNVAEHVAEQLEVPTAAIEIKFKWINKQSGKVVRMNEHETETMDLTDLRAVWRVLIIAFTLAVCAFSANADDHRRERQQRRESRNYILERQEAYQVQGTPTSRLIIGKREIDVYPNGLMFEKNNVVGVKH